MKEKSKLDVQFIDFYVRKKYKKDLSDYYMVTPSVASKWKHNYFPDQRIHEFAFREGSSNVIELIKTIYE